MAVAIAGCFLSPCGSHDSGAFALAFRGIRHSGGCGGQRWCHIGQTRPVLAMSTTTAGLDTPSTAAATAAAATAAASMAIVVVADVGGAVAVIVVVAHTIRRHGLAGPRHGCWLARWPCSGIRQVAALSTCRLASLGGWRTPDMPHVAAFATPCIDGATIITLLLLATIGCCSTAIGAPSARRSALGRLWAGCSLWRRSMHTPWTVHSISLCHRASWLLVRHCRQDLVVCEVADGGRLICSVSSGCSVPPRSA